tara:strand:- start:34 stop:1104 length:1071 start_codon:yes stop_codon:yes gene_type:complete
MEMKKEADSLDNELLNLLQSEFPISERPFFELGERLSISEAEVIERIQKLKDINYIRQISAIFDTRSMKYKSTLVAMSFEDSDVDKAAEVINQHPGVTHNYKRNHFYNLWFTLAVPPDSKIGLEGTVDILTKLSSAKSTRMLPTLKLYKIGVKLDMTGKDSLSLKDDKFYGEENISKDYDLSAIDTRIIKQVQEDFPLISNPYSYLAERAGVTTQELISCLSKLNSKGVMRRVAAILHHRKAGFRANAMGVWKVPVDKIEEVAPVMSSLKSVSHCYRRPTYPDWPYSLFTMVHGRSSKDCESIIKSLSDMSGITDYDSLYSSKEYKKTRLKYFSTEQESWENAHMKENTNAVSSNN